MGASGCADWALPITCADRELCIGGTCVAGCRDLCGPEGVWRCQGPGTAACERQASGRLDWGVVTPCPPGQVCSGGTCQARCFDECTEGASIR
ncbi:MAG: hypothetical protein QME96_17120 [Myxococcota bacterium]|nr:hypothetical protein [Myxococcota bacterium]